MGPRLRARLSGEKFQSPRKYLRDLVLSCSQAIETGNHELESFESLESVPRTAVRLRGDDNGEIRCFRGDERSDEAIQLISSRSVESLRHKRPHGLDRMRAEVLVAGAGDAEKALGAFDE